MNQNQKVLDQRLKEFRKKFYKDKIIRGSLILALIFSSILFVVLLSEGIFGFSTTVRTSLVFGLGIIFLGVLAYMVAWPLAQLFNLSQTISDFQIADIVKRTFPEINDKLINFLQLKREFSGSNALAGAALDRKAADIAPVQLSSAINLQLNRRYLWFLIIPVLLYLITYIANPSFLSSSGHRLLNYNTAFTPPPPFSINIQEIPSDLVSGQDYTMKINVNGPELPSELFIFMKDDSEEGGQFIDYNLNKTSSTDFEYTLSEIKNDFTFYIGNPEVSSEAYSVRVLKRPFIKNFSVRINYPAYTNLGSEKLEDNIGDFKVIKGSTVTWELEPQGDLSSAEFVGISPDNKSEFKKGDKDSYAITRRLMEDLNYFISLTSTDDISNIDTVKYKVNVLQDRYPSIYVFSPNNDYLVDLDPVMPLDLEIADDYGFTKMSLFYRFTKSGGTSEVSETFREYSLDISPSVLLQPLSYSVDLTRLGLQEGDELEYYIKVWDNDGVSGAKATTSATYKVVHPTLDAKYDDINEAQDQVKEQLEKLRETSETLKEDYRKMQEKLLDQKKLSFDDKKEVQRIIEEHQNMMQQMEEAQKKFEETKEQLQENQMISEQTLEKYEELNKFMEELDNPEIEKLLEELQERMENLNPEDIMNKMEELQMNDEDLQESLERTLELLKQLEVQEKIDELRNKLDNLEAKQDMLNEKLEQADSPEDMENVSDRQEDLNKQMEGIEEDIKDLKEMKENTETPDSENMEGLEEKADDTQEDMDAASEEMQKSAEEMQEGGRKNKKESEQSKQNASQKQKDASQKMQEMSEQLSSMQMNMQMEQDQQNLENLRELLENLLKLSFDQEDLRDEVKEIKPGDPALKDKSQTQKKLQDDMGLVKDSLESLANRLFQIQKFVLDESKSINENMQKSQTFFRNKQVPMITYHQSTAMTSINNLANMLSDVMKQVQEQMMNAMPGQGMCKKPGDQQKANMKGLSEQQQKLNEQLQQMMNSKQMGKDQLSEMAAKQEAIRKQLEEAKNKMEKEGGKALGDLDKIMQDMKESETEMINKQLTHETLMRQQQILSRLLQADQSVRERELDDKRESKAARELDRKSPEELSIEEYKNKIRQEMLKSNKLEYSNDFLILIEQYFKTLEEANE
ncbi:MAG: hypothetical protein KDD99_02200 [Bacteroidetes bacterium]|nr:hypothetical protein [Bacteroidota bacterium]